MATTPEIVRQLVEKFRTNADHYTSPAYNETLCRVDFINPMFEALGWDVVNRAGYAEAYRDVIYEDAIKIGGATKAPDYCFRIGGTRKFFLEAKKPGVDLKRSPDSAYQLRRYAWSAKLPLSILTDFQEFAVYDCRVRPDKQDKPSTARVFYCTCDDYVDQWDKIASIFARESVLKGSFDRYAETARDKRGTVEVDAAFLKEIESWREALARNLALRNELSQRDLNFAVQRIIDRIIFLRICEDRGIEAYAQLQGLLNEPNTYARLQELFNRADERYNSGLFHFQREKDHHEAPDELTPGLTVDDTVLKEIIRSLYYPDSPYEFSVLPADILGQVYEQFLGKEVRLTPGHRVVVEDKPEVRKAGGVYYTPTYIVDYIVRNTVGKLLEGKTPQQVGGLTETFNPSRTQWPIAVLDPACGSGSFLIGAYQYLLDWYRDQYVKDDPKAHATGCNPRLYQRSGGDWRLTTAERKRILLAHIYGVDIDPQAVEVTKLSLLLKVLEGESGELINQQLRMFHERVLPNLDDNIKCGNSLIGPDFYNNQQMMLLDTEERLRINVFDWNAEFPDIMKAGGFDAVIGNPPYIGFHGFADQKDYLRTHFQSAEGKFDIYLPFIEAAVRLLKNGGFLTYICPTNFMKRGHGAALRCLLRTSVTILEICDFQDMQVFKGALNYTGIMSIRKASPDDSHAVHYKQRSLDDSGFMVRQSFLKDDAWVFQNVRDQQVVDRVRAQAVSTLAEMTQGISEGIVTGQNEVFLLSRASASNLGLEDELLRPCIRGRQIRRYRLDTVEEVVIYPYRLVGQRTVSIPEYEMRCYPRIWAYLTGRRGDLGGRSYFEKSSKAWYELWCQRDIRLLSANKIVVPELSESNRFALADPTQYYGDTVCGITLRDDTPESLNYVLGVLNSKLTEFYYKRTTVPKANQFFIYKTMFLRSVPVRRIDFSHADDKAKHDRMVLLVDQMLSLHRQLAAAKTGHEKEVFQRQIDATDRQIDWLVYELYGLTEDEIRIVEGATEN